MVEGVLMPTPVPQWLPNPKASPPTSCSLLAAHHTVKERWLVDCPTLSRGIGAEELPSSKGFPWNLWLLGSEEGGNNCPGHSSLEQCSSIGNAPRSTMWSGAGALPVSFPLLEGDGLLNLEMLVFAEKDSITPAPAYPTPEAKEEEQVTLQVPEEPCTSVPEEAVHLVGRLDLVWGRFPSVLLGFAYSHANQTHTRLAWGIPLGEQLDLHSLGSLWVTISQTPAIWEVQCEYQSWVITQASLQMPQFEPTEPSDSPPRIKELWENMILFLPAMSNSTTPQLLDAGKWPGMYCELIHVCDWCR